MLKILVTGATGFVGRSLVPALIQAGYQVRCAVTHKIDWLLAEQILIERLEEQADWTELLNGIDVVIHLAARVHVMKEKSASPLEDFCKINSIATKKLAEQAAKIGVKRFVFLSTVKVNGEFTQIGNPFTEQCIPNPQDYYGQSKLYAEQHLLSISKNTTMQVVILRPPLIYGPRVKANFLKIMGLVNTRLPLPFAKINNKRHFIYIENLISAICCVIENPKAANQVFLVADDTALSLTQLIKLIAKGMDTRVRLLPIYTGVLTTIFKCLGLTNLSLRLLGTLEVSNNKIKTELSWSPPVSSEEGVAKTAKWYKCNT